MSLLCEYTPAKSCTSGPQTGARAFMSWYLGAYRKKGGHNLGIYNCRPVAGSSTTSLHGEGRACDLGVRPHSAAWGRRLSRLLVKYSRELGVQCVIWDREIWSGARCKEGFRPYGGRNPHTDHLHVEFTWHAARTLTASHVQKVIGGGRSRSKPAPSKYEPYNAQAKPYQRLIYGGHKKYARWSAGADVRWLQAHFSRVYPAYDDTPLAVDGKFGPKTRGAVLEFQKRAGLKVDGEVGRRTWSKIRRPA